MSYGHFEDHLIPFNNASGAVYSLHDSNIHKVDTKTMCMRWLEIQLLLSYQVSDCC